MSESYKNDEDCIVGETRISRQKKYDRTEKGRAVKKKTNARYREKVKSLKPTTGNQ